MPARITQFPIETSIAPTDGFIRVTQITTETSIAPTDGFIRITQIVIETSISYDGSQQFAACLSNDFDQYPSQFAYTPDILEDLNLYADQDIIIIVPMFTWDNDAENQMLQLGYRIQDIVEEKIYFASTPATRRQSRVFVSV